MGHGIPSNLADIRKRMYASVGVLGVGSQSHFFLPL
jgi:hypothetical protein